MSEQPPQDLFDVVCRLDDLADWLDEAYPNEAAALRTVADDLKGYIVITAVQTDRA